LGLEELESVNDDNFKFGRNYPFNVNKKKKTEITHCTEILYSSLIIQ